MYRIYYIKSNLCSNDTLTQLQGTFGNALKQFCISYSVA